MIIAVTSTGTSPHSPIDPRFGRCGYFLFVDTDSAAWTAVANPHAALGGGAGIQSAQLLADQGAQHLLTGNCGPNAYQTLSAAGIRVVVGCSGTVQAAVEAFRAGTVQPAAQANVPDHFGLGRGRGTGLGRGMGRGLQRARAAAEMAGSGAAVATDPEEHLAELHRQAQVLRDQLQQIQTDIQRIEGT